MAAAGSGARDIKEATTLRLDGAHPRPGPHFRHVAPKARQPKPQVIRPDAVGWPDDVAKLFELTGPALLNVVQRGLFARSFDTLPGLALLSVVPRCGKTTVALALARAAAELGERVLLVDLDFERPALARRLGIRLDDGTDPAVMEEGLETVRPFWKPLFIDRRRNLGLLAPTLVACSRRGRHGAMRELKELLPRLSDQFALAIYDTTALSHSGAVPPEAIPATSAVLVRRTGETDDELAELRLKVAQAHMALEAIIETFAPVAPSFSAAA